MREPLSRLALSAMLAVIVLAQTAAAAIRQPEIWLAPLQPTVRQDGTQAGSVDFFSLFDPSAPWKTASAHVSVFKIYPQLLREASDAQLRILIRGLADRHIALSLESAVLVDTVDCGPSGKHDRWMPELVGRLKRLGADLRSVAMVGPLVDGRNLAAANACHASIAAVAADAARTVTALRLLYPKLEVGEIEPIGSGPAYPDWNELDAWFHAFRVASGRPIAFLHVDTEWGKSWQASMLNVAHRVRLAHIRFGVIYDGTPLDLSDVSFAEDAQEHADEVEALLVGPPDDVVIQSWQDYPRLALPDSDLSSMTGIVRAYVRARTRLALLPGRRVLLSTVGGVAVPHAEITVETHDPGKDGGLAPQTMAGTVPHTAVSALFALRIHAECACSHDAVALSISAFEFGRPGAAASVKQELQAGQIRSAGIIAPAEAYLSVAASQPLVMNGPSFPVEADKSFVARFAWHVDQSSAGAGFLSLIFLGKDGREIRRTAIPLQPSWIKKATLRSGVDGTVKLPADVGSGSQSVQVGFAGDLSDKPVVSRVATTLSARDGSVRP